MKFKGTVKVFLSLFCLAYKLFPQAFDLLLAGLYLLSRNATLVNNFLEN